jgi:hypothetical protein
VVKYLLKIDRLCFDRQLLLYAGKMKSWLGGECVRLPERPRVDALFARRPAIPLQVAGCGTVCQRLRAGGRRSYGASFSCDRQ